MKAKVFLQLIVVFILSVPTLFSQQLKFSLGIHRPNLTWVKPAGNQLIILDKIAATGTDAIRLNPRPGGENDLIQQILYANKLGMKVNLDLPALYNDFYEKGTEEMKRKRWGSRLKLSDLKPDKVKKWASVYFDKIKSAGAKVEVIEFGNEMNWVDFNGDMPEITGGILYDFNTEWNDANYVQIRKGIEKYCESLKVIREEIDRVWGVGKVKLITGGLVRYMSLTDWHKNNDASIMIPNLWLTLMKGIHPNQKNATDYLKYVDGYALHFYPQTAVLDMQKQGKILAEELKVTMDPIVSLLGNEKPFWVTEWGYQRVRTEFTSEQDRYIAAKNFLLVCNELPYNWDTFYFFTFDMTKKHNMYENNEYLPVSKIFEMKRIKN